MVEFAFNSTRTTSPLIAALGLTHADIVNPVAPYKVESVAVLKFARKPLAGKFNPVPTCPATVAVAASPVTSAAPVVPEKLLVGAPATEFVTTDPDVSS